MGEDKEHARFTLVTAGGARSRGVAFGSPPKALAPAADVRTTTSRCASSATAGTGWSSRARSCARSARPSPARCACWARRARSGSACAARSAPAPPEPAARRAPEPLDRRARGLRRRGRRPVHQRRARARRRGGRRTPPGGPRADRRGARAGRHGRRLVGPDRRRTRRLARAPTTTWSRSTRRRAASPTRCCARAARPHRLGARPRPSSPSPSGAPSWTCGRRSRTPTARCASCPPDAGALQRRCRARPLPARAALRPLVASWRARADRVRADRPCRVLERRRAGRSAAYRACGSGWGDRAGAGAELPRSAARAA